MVVLPCSLPWHSIILSFYLFCCRNNLIFLLCLLEPCDLQFHYSAYCHVSLLFLLFPLLRLTLLSLLVSAQRNIRLVGVFTVNFSLLRSVGIFYCLSLGYQLVVFVTWPKFLDQLDMAQMWGQVLVYWMCMVSVPQPCGTVGRYSFTQCYRGEGWDLCW